MKNIKDLSVGEVSSRNGISIPTLHFYEKKGLISSKRYTSNHRRFDRAILRKIAVIKAAQKAGISLADIVEQLKTIPNDDKVSNDDWEKLSSRWKKDLDDRIERITLLRNSLAYCIGCGCLSVKHCALMNPEDKLFLKGAEPQPLEPDVAAEALSQFTQ
jgi:MerR family redox-sensitive transcriptional activator SoxR